ncbi:peroxisomal membrane protein PEX16 [Fopius arisanus]|uniref:Peroxisomal membrane protein PEX16 n=1 Tax=Fopius arisanus TaxID=64838 RepID=A0A9R1SVS0_9HYME|nr:PREDICTED: peroxisomal membrane protein PEX16 [Fopius arisanus]XP_011298035.1 PREDICTED: peroxisomal membrane protein PEX16 [Fopius arisanus]
MVIQSLPASVRPYLEAYMQWITTKPQVISDIESTVRCLSYFTAGRFGSSSLTSELIYSVPNLLILLNDHLLYTAKYTHLNLPQFQSQIKIWLTIIEYTEALIEVGAKKLWGERGKWLLILVVQLFKSVMRLILVHHDKERITITPIPPLNREKLSSLTFMTLGNLAVPLQHSVGFRLGRSGTFVRSVNASGPIQSRIWAPLKPENEDTVTESPVTKRNLLIAETLYIMKPIIHLTTFVMKGNKNWLPWVTALTLDLVSLHLISKETKHTVYTKEEKEEITRRRISLLLYILRSPFYDSCSKARIFALLDGLSNNIPLARFVAEPIAKYLPHWQKTYFYMWSR